MQKVISHLNQNLFHSGRAMQVVTLITLFRCVVAPLILILAFTDHIVSFKWLLLACFLTDAIDGFLARRLKAQSSFGAQLDSVGDDLTFGVAVVGLIPFKPEFFSEELLTILLLGGLLAIQIMLALIRYRKISSFHTYLAKSAAVCQAVFLMSMYFFTDTPYFLFYLAAGVTLLDLIEEIILVFIISEWKTDVKGLWWVMRKGNGEK